MLMIKEARLPTSQVSRRDKCTHDTYNHRFFLPYSWSEKHYPYYFKKVRDVVEPACDYTMTILGDGLLYLDNVTTPARLYIHKNVPPLLEKVCWKLKCQGFNAVYSHCYCRSFSLTVSSRGGIRHFLRGVRLMSEGYSCVG